MKTSRTRRSRPTICLMIVLILLVVAVGGLVEIVPLFFQKSTTEPVAGLKPYTPLQLAGRDIYMREGCYNCHSQMIRPFRAETQRYGHYSVAGEFVYDHPFQWGSKRTGPDLHRVGGKYSDEWHRIHLDNPRDVVPESNMPAYPWLATTQLDAATDRRRSMRALRSVGVPYTDAEIAEAPNERQGQDRAGRADRLPAGAGHSHQAQRRSSHGHRYLRHSPARSPSSLRDLHRHRASGPVAPQRKALRRGRRAAVRRRRRAHEHATRQERAMSDFTQRLLVVYVAVVTLGRHRSACGVLLWSQWRMREWPSSRTPGDNTTGHVWDEDLTELNNPMPRWWMWLFYITIVFALAYLVLYPGPGQLRRASSAGRRAARYAGRSARGRRRATRRCMRSYLGSRT